MKLLRLLADNFKKSEFVTKLRNSLNIKPVYFKPFTNNRAISVSDAFLWRTDNNFETKFKYSDILNLFYKIKNSWVEIHFYSKNNDLIKIEKINNLNISNEFNISAKYIGTKDFGTFYIYHFSKEKIEEINILSNRCYLGFSQNGNLHSYVHGNTYAKFTEINPSRNFSTDIITTSFSKNQFYTIQKYFENFDKNELFFINPTSKKISFSIENNNYLLGPGCSKIVNVKGPIITIVSNCLFLRPTVFSYNEKYLDVHHS